MESYSKQTYVTFSTSFVVSAAGCSRKNRFTTMFILFKIRQYVVQVYSCRTGTALISKKEEERYNQVFFLPDDVLHYLVLDRH